MPPRRTANQRRVAEEDKLYRRIEQIIDTWLNPSDDAIFVAGGNREPEFDEEEEDDEVDDKGYDENRKFDEFEGNDVGLFAFAEYDEDDKEADAVWEAINKRMDSRRKDRRETRLKQEIEKYCASNQQMRMMMSDTDAASAEACSLDVAFAFGTTTLVATVMGRLLVVANAGDCRGVLFRRGKAIEMSRDHNPVSAKERKQIGASGVYVYDGYLNGQLHAILSLGRNFISGLLGPILSTQGRMMRQKTWQIGISRKTGSDDHVSRETASGAK
ncbi:hypothetical protein CRG98_013176 [Punica granatum]|uniref:PPM-type phosphatase domain-containing protein n=1 Tax=Punica granatum TaxID=22663 RepID=A0A2I0KCV9_PUNGR|nr:hypothetical protein CRG98_013176 [Punica granatum]